MAFRLSETLQRNELVRFQLDSVIRAPANGTDQKKDGYVFTINDRSAYYDWYNAYFEVQFQLQKKADGAGYAAADRITVINGSLSCTLSCTRGLALGVLQHWYSVVKVVILSELIFQIFHHISITEGYCVSL